MSAGIEDETPCRTEVGMVVFRGVTTLPLALLLFFGLQRLPIANTSPGVSAFTSPKDVGMAVNQFVR